MQECTNTMQPMEWLWNATFDTSPVYRDIRRFFFSFPFFAEHVGVVVVFGCIVLFAGPNTIWAFGGPGVAVDDRYTHAHTHAKGHHHQPASAHAFGER